MRCVGESTLPSRMTNQSSDIKILGVIPYLSFQSEPHGVVWNGNRSFFSGTRKQASKQDSAQCCCNSCWLASQIQAIFLSNPSISLSRSPHSCLWVSQNTNIRYRLISYRQTYYPPSLFFCGERSEEIAIREKWQAWSPSCSLLMRHTDIYQSR